MNLSPFFPHYLKSVALFVILPYRFSALSSWLPLIFVIILFIIHPKWVNKRSTVYEKVVWGILVIFILVLIGGEIEPCGHHLPLNIWYKSTVGGFSARNRQKRARSCDFLEWVELENPNSDQTSDRPEKLSPFLDSAGGGPTPWVASGDGGVSQ